MIIRLLGPVKDLNRLRVRALVGSLAAEVTESGSARLTIVLEGGHTAVLALDSPEDLLRLARQAIAAAEGFRRDVDARWQANVRDLLQRERRGRDRLSQSGTRRKPKAQGKRRRGR